MHVLLPLYNCSNAVEQVAPGVFELRPGSPPRQGLTPPLPPWQGLWPSGIDTAWASVLPSHPAADTRVKAEQSGGPLETLERVTVRGRGIHGQEPTYCVLSRSLSYSVNHSVTTSHALPPSYLLVHLLHSNLLGQIFTLFFPPCKPLSRLTLLCHLLVRLNSWQTLLHDRVCTLSSTRSTILH